MKTLALILGAAIGLSYVPNLSEYKRKDSYLAKTLCVEEINPITNKGESKACLYDLNSDNQVDIATLRKREEGPFMNKEVLVSYSPWTKKFVREIKEFYINGEEAELNQRDRDSFNLVFQSYASFAETRILYLRK